MVSRCNTPSATFYEHYTARGIAVCARWRKFENFIADMGERPKGLTIERIDNTRGYEPGNCRWATMREQANNRSSNRHFEYKGERVTLAELSRLSGVGYRILQCRLCESKLPWTVEGAIRTPPLPNGSARFYC